MKIGDLLPVGSVVMVKEATKAMMIIGILPEDNGVRYDYLAVLHPEGYLTSEQIYLFNHEDIEKVEYLGFMNAQYQVFRNDLQLIYDNQE